MRYNMIMVRVFKRATTLSLAVLLGVIGLGVHAGAMPQHSMQSAGEMSHGASSSSFSCTTICNSTPQNKNESADEINEDDNDVSPEPYFVQFQSSLIDALGNLHAEQTKTAIDREPPLGIPAYIALAVFRS